MLRLDAFSNHYSHTLFGGQKRRVAPARASVNEPQLFLLDQPI